MSASKRQFSIALESSLELKVDKPAPHSKAIPVPPDLNSVLAEIGPLPREALFLGVASDGLPVLLNMHDPVPGPLLVVGDAGVGKTRFLRSIVHSLMCTHKQDDLQYGVATNHPDEWSDVENDVHCAGVFPVNSASAQDFMLSLASRAHEKGILRRPVLLLVDDLEVVAKWDFDTIQSFRWLLARGPARRVWPIITMNAERYGLVISWIPGFRTRIFGRIRDTRVAEALSSDRVSALGKLEAPIQFSLCENGKWVRFWLPSC